MKRLWVSAWVSVVACAVPAVAAPPEAKTGFLERTVKVGEASHAYKVYVPPAFDPGRKWPVILFLHGAGERGHRRRPPDRGGPRAGPPLRPRALPGGGRVPAGAARRRLAGPARALRHRRPRPDGRGVPAAIPIASTWPACPWARTPPGCWPSSSPDRYAAIVSVAGGIVPPSGRRARLAELPPTLQADDPYAATAARVKDVPAWLFHGADDPTVPGHRVAADRGGVQAGRRAGAVHRVRRCRPQRLGPRLRGAGAAHVALRAAARRRRGRPARLSRAASRRAGPTRGAAPTCRRCRSRAAGPRPRRRSAAAAPGARQRGHLRPRVAQAQHAGQVADLVRGVARAERLEREAPLDQLQDRGVVEPRVAHAREGGVAARERRRHHAPARGSRAAPCRRRRPGPTSLGATTRGGAHVVEEAAPLVVVDDEHGARPAGPVRHRVEDAGEERVARADVGVRMVVVRARRRRAVDEPRVDERDARAACRPRRRRGTRRTRRRSRRYFEPPERRGTGTFEK